MNRAAVVASLLIALVSSGCDTLFFPSKGTQAGLSGVGPDGGVCTKDPQTIKNVMLAPPACNATNPCPCGTFCSSQTGGNCVADCVDDTWCAPGYTCSGFGQCQGATSGPDGGPPPTTDPSCPKNAALLDSLLTMNRSCQFDDICPYGSYCNHATEICTADCRTDSNCASMNSAGHTFVCSCLGQCAEVSAPRKPPSRVLPTIELTPTRYGFVRPATITTPNWGDTNQRRIQVVVVAPFLTGTPAVGPTVTIRANPGPGLLVACPGVGTPTASSCPYSVPTVATNYTKVGDVYRSAPIFFTVQPSTGAGYLTATTWQLRLDSDDLGNAPQTINLRYADTIDTSTPPAPVPVSAPDPTFTGIGKVEMLSPTGFPVRINVKARAYGGNLVVFDETQQLSPSGKLVFVSASSGTGTQYYQTFLNPELGNDLALQDVATGWTAQKVVNPLLWKDPTSGSMSGSFQRVVYGDSFSFLSFPDDPAIDLSTSGTFFLAAATPSSIGACTMATDCATGTCDLGFCSSLPPQRFTGQITNSAQIDHFSHKRMTRWGEHKPYNYMSFDTEQTGFWGLYVPSSSYLPQVSPLRGYRLHGPVPFISGEPLADLFAATGGVLVANVPQVAFPLLTQHDGNYPQNASNLLKACLSELARDRINPPVGSTGPSNPGLTSDSEVFDTYATCINLGRVAWVTRDHTTFQRGLQAWLEVHSFVLREGLEEINAATANGGIPGSSDPSASPLRWNKS